MVLVGRSAIEYGREGGDLRSVETQTHKLGMRVGSGHQSQPQEAGILGAPYRGFIHQHMVRNNFEWLQITDEHLAGVVDLPLHHKDPFDRMLAAQALCEQTPVVSVDTQLDAYGVTRIW
jgi:hypothetical protein